MKFLNTIYNINTNYHSNNSSGIRICVAQLYKTILSYVSNYALKININIIIILYINIKSIISV